MTNACNFSPCRSYRYTLRHNLYSDFEILPAEPRRIMWIGLNPSTADENQLDATLRRIRAYSKAWGFTEFVMTNLFAYRAKLPRVMKRQADACGPQNDDWLSRTAFQSDAIIACWGTHGKHRGRAQAVTEMLRSDFSLSCLGVNADGSPKHPLYLNKAAVVQPFP